MNILDYIIMAVIAGLFIYAIYKIIRYKKNGSMCLGCQGCNRKDCVNCKYENNKEK